MAEKEEDLLKTLQEKNLEESLYKARKIFLWSDVNDESAKAVVTRLLSLDVEDPTEEIVLYINSPGGSVHDGMAIYDAMLAIQAPVSTVCMGMAMSMGSFLLSAGEPGRSFRLAARPDHDPSAEPYAHHHRHGHRPRHPRQGDHPPARRAKRALRQAHRPRCRERSPRTRTATSSCRPRKPRHTACSTT